MHGSRLLAGPPGRVISQLRSEASDKPNYHLILPSGTQSLGIRFESCVSCWAVVPYETCVPLLLAAGA